MMMMIERSLDDDDDDDGDDRVSAGVGTIMMIIIPHAARSEVISQ
jgi:hypothetical protein